jgi:hypothetical protein
MRLTLTVVTVDPTFSSNDLNVLEFFTSPNFRLKVSPKLPKIEVVLSPAIFTTSDVFWYLNSIGGFCFHLIRYEITRKFFNFLVNNVAVS